MYPEIKIVPYNPEWPKWFSLMANRLKESLGDLALEIQHIGSTSVPGLGSKNRIDIQVLIPEISVSFQTHLDERLLKAGFRSTQKFSDHRPPGDESADLNWEKFYFNGQNKDPAFHFNIHFRVPGRSNAEYPILFRDYLRGHPKMAKSYQALKEKLAHYHSSNIEAYVEIKDPVCDLIINAASEWRGREAVKI